jgi:DNA-binding MarR family transcriptional regulator
MIRGAVSRDQQAGSTEDAKGARAEALVPGGTRPAEHAGTRTDIGYLLAKGSQHWNELLAEAFRRKGHGDVRPSYGSVLVPLFEEDGLRMSELASRARLAKQTMTTMVRLVEQAGLVRRRPDPEDARATRVHLTARGRRFRPVAERELIRLEARITAHLGAARTAALRASLAQLVDA